MKKINKVLAYIVSSGAITQLLQVVAESLDVADVNNILLMGIVNVLLFLSIQGREALKS